LADAAQPRLETLEVCHSSNAWDSIAIWVAQEAGICKKYRLDGYFVGHVGAEFIQPSAAATAV